MSVFTYTASIQEGHGIGSSPTWLVHLASPAGPDYPEFHGTVNVYVDELPIAQVIDHGAHLNQVVMAAIRKCFPTADYKFHGGVLKYNQPHTGISVVEMDAELADSVNEKSESDVDWFYRLLNSKFPGLNQSALNSVVAETFRRLQPPINKTPDSLRKVMDKLDVEPTDALYEQANEVAITALTLLGHDADSTKDKVGDDATDGLQTLLIEAFLREPNLMAFVNIAEEAHKKGGVLFSHHENWTEFILRFVEEV